MIKWRLSSRGYWENGAWTLSLRHSHPPISCHLIRLVPVLYSRTLSSIRSSTHTLRASTNSQRILNGKSACCLYWPIEVQGVEIPLLFDCAFLIIMHWCESLSNVIRRVINSWFTASSKEANDSQSEWLWFPLYRGSSEAIPVRCINAYNTDDDELLNALRQRTDLWWLVCT